MWHKCKIGTTNDSAMGVAIDLEVFALLVVEENEPIESRQASILTASDHMTCPPISATVLYNQPGTPISNPR